MPTPKCILLKATIKAQKPDLRKALLLELESHAKKAHVYVQKRCYIGWLRVSEVILHREILLLLMGNNKMNE